MLYEYGIENKQIQRNPHIELGVSNAFFNKTLVDGYTKTAYSDSFHASRLTVNQVIDHITSGKAITLSTFKNNKRTRDNFKQSQLLALDLDDNVSLDDCQANALIRQYAFFIGDTATSKPTFRKTRVYFRLEQPITDRVLWEQAQSAVIYKFQALRPDEACKDVSRLFYGSTNGTYETFDQLLPFETLTQWIDEFQASSTELDKRTPDQNDRIIEQNKLYTATDNRYEAYAQATLVNRCNELSSLSDGRNQYLLNSAILLGTMVGAGMINEFDVIQGLTNAALASGYKRDINGVITRGLAYGQAKPFDLSNLQNKLYTATHNRRKLSDKPQTIEDRIQNFEPVGIVANVGITKRYISELNLQDLFLKHNLIAVKSGMGTGKTEAISQYIKDNPHLSVLIVTPFEQLSVASAQRFEVESYKGFGRDMLSKVKRLAITAKSLPKLQHNNGDYPTYDLIVIDEVDHIHQQFHDSDIYKSNEAIQAQEAYSQLLINAGRVFISSAHISDLDLDLVEKYTRDTKRAYAIENKYKRPMPALTIHANYQYMIHTALTTSTSATKPVLIACGGLKTARLIAHLALKYGLQKDEIFVLSSRNSHTDKVRSIINNPDEYIPRYKLFIYTFAAGVGMDYTGPSAGAFGVFNNRNMTPLADIQMLERARYADSYHAYITPGICDLETDGDEIKGRVIRNLINTEKLTGIVAPISAINKKFLTLGSKLIAQNNYSRTDKLSCFVALAEDQGHTIKTCDNTATDETRQLWKTVREQFKEAEKQNTVSVDYRLSAQEFEAKRRDRSLTGKDFYARKADIIEQTTGVLIDDETYNLFHKSSNRSALRLFTDTLGITSDKMIERDKLEAQDNTPLLKRTHYTLRQDLLRNFLINLAGVDNLRLVPQALVKTGDLLQDQWLDRVSRFLWTYGQDVKDVFNWRQDYSKDPFKFLQWVLSRVGLRLTRGKRSSEGNRPYYYYFDYEKYEVMRRYAKSLREHLETQDTDYNPLSISRIEHNLIRVLDKSTDFDEQSILRPDINALKVEAIPI